MSDLGTWVALAAVALGLIAGWVKLNNKIATMETRALADKSACDTQLALMRAEVVAVEARGNDRVGDLRDQLTRIDGKVDRLLERQ